MTNEELIENYPVYMDNRHDLKLCCNAFLKPFPKKDSLDYSVLCETGITFSKGGMPFHATFKHDYERDDDYFDITPYGKDTPHLTLYSNKIEYPLTLESMQYELEEVVDTAFYDGRLDAQEIEPHPYFTEIDDFEDFLEVVDCDIHRSEEGAKIEDTLYTQRDIGDVRLTITPVKPRRTDDGWTDLDPKHLMINLAIMEDPKVPYHSDPTQSGEGVKVMSFDFTQDIQNATPEAIRDMLNAQLTSLVRVAREGRDDPELDHLEEALESKEYRWMQNELYHSTISPYLDGAFIESAVKPRLLGLGI